MIIWTITNWILSSYIYLISHIEVYLVKEMFAWSLYFIFKHVSKIIQLWYAAMSAWMSMIVACVHYLYISFYNFHLSKMSWICLKHNKSLWNKLLRFAFLLPIIISDLKIFSLQRSNKICKRNEYHLSYENACLYSGSESLNVFQVHIHNKWNLKLGLYLYVSRCCFKLLLYCLNHTGRTNFYYLSKGNILTNSYVSYLSGFLFNFQQGLMVAGENGIQQIQ